MLYRGPKFHTTRFPAFKYKINRATGIPRKDINLQFYTISTKSYDIVWLVLDERIIQHIFNKAAIDQTPDFNAFSSIPKEVPERKKGIKKILKGLHSIDNELRY